MVFTRPPHLAGCTVGHASALIIRQVEVGGAGTLVAPSRGEEAEVTAAAVVGLARVVEHWVKDGIKQLLHTVTRFKVFPNLLSFRC